MTPRDQILLALGAFVALIYPDSFNSDMPCVDAPRCNPERFVRMTSMKTSLDDLCQAGFVRPRARIAGQSVQTPASIRLPKQIPSFPTDP